MFDKKKFMSFYDKEPFKTNAGKCYDAVQNALIKLGIYSDLTMAGVMATIRVEVGKEFLPIRENLNYSAQGLLKIFPKYFDNITAQRYAYQPVMIANRVYANRLGNGNEASGDGWTYRGTGFIQFTGKGNWNAAGITQDNCLDVEKNAIATAKYFKDKGCNIACNNSDWVKVRKLVNGGENGLDLFRTVIGQYLG